MRNNQSGTRFAYCLATTAFLSGCSALTVDTATALASTQGLLLAVIASLILGIVWKAVWARRHERVNSHGNLELALAPSRDAESGLPNRLTFERTVEGALRRAGEEQGRCVVLCVEVHGVRALDALIDPAFPGRLFQELAQMLMAASHKAFPYKRFAEAGLARIADFSLALLIEECSDPESLVQLAAQIVQLVASSQARSPQTRSVVLSATVGVADSHETENARDLIHQAQVAAQMVRETADGKLMRFTAQIAQDARRSAALVSDLRQAVSDGQLRLLYQPQVDAVSGRIVAAEALLRWHHPVRGVVMPDLFIPTAERMGLIDEIGSWVIDEACRQAGAWRRQGLRLHLAVNLSSVQLQRPDAVDRILAALARNRVPPSGLTCEVTESIAMDSAHVARNAVARLSEAGVRIAIDDFGTGYSSLSYMYQLPLHELKIDRSFVNKATFNRSARAVVQAIIRLANELDLRVVAEGIETIEERDALLDLGAQLFQGFLYARPMTAASVLELARHDQQDPQVFNESVFKSTDTQEP